MSRSICAMISDLLSGVALFNSAACFSSASLRRSFLRIWRASLSEIMEWLILRWRDIPPNSDYTDHPSVYQSMLISFTSLLLQGVSNEKQSRVNLAITDSGGIAAIREFCRRRHASRQAFSMRLRDSTVALPRRWDCVSTELQHKETHEWGYDQGQKCRIRSRKTLRLQASGGEGQRRTSAAPRQRGHERTASVTAGFAAGGG